jgi:uncharacterized membrane protein SpoIIM required for sporulation
MKWPRPTIKRRFEKAAGSQTSSRLNSVMVGSLPILKFSLFIRAASVQVLMRPVCFVLPLAVIILIVVNGGVLRLATAHEDWGGQ